MGSWQSALVGADISIDLYFKAKRCFEDVARRQKKAQRRRRLDHYINALVFREAQNKFTNEQILQGVHLQEAFAGTCVLGLDRAFFQRVCKRSRDVCSKFPVPIVGQRTQGKSSLVNSILTVRHDNQEQAPVGKHSSTTVNVKIYSVEVEGMGEILLADTPGWHSSEMQERIFSDYEETLERFNCDPDMSPHLIILVIAGLPPSLCELQDGHAFQKIEKAYREMHKSAELNMRWLPVITFADHMTDKEKRSEAEYVRSRLQALRARGSAHKRSELEGSEILEPLLVSNKDLSGVETLFSKVKSTLLNSFESANFRKQWTHMLNEDLVQCVKDFRSQHQDAETERRLYHCAVQAVLASYGQESVRQIADALPEVDWKGMKLLERRLRGEDAVDPAGDQAKPMARNSSHVREFELLIY